MVATASLELGIDIGSIDLVVQLGSPRSIAVALQRIGRSGHWVGAKPEGRIFVTTRDELLECAALVRGDARRRARRAAKSPRRRSTSWRSRSSPRARSTSGATTSSTRLVRGAYPYRELARRDFDDVVSMLADGVATSRGRSGTFLHYDRVNGVLRARRGARLAAITCGGAIPDTANYNVVVEPDGHVVGTLDEDFAIESMAGDIFLLGTNSWKMRRVEAGVVRVEDAHGAPPYDSVLERRGARAHDRAVARGLAPCARRSTSATMPRRSQWLEASAHSTRAGAEQAVAYVRAGKADRSASSRRTTRSSPNASSTRAAACS